MLTSPDYTPITQANAPPTASEIALDHVSVEFATGKQRTSRAAIADTNLTIAAGEFVAIVGPTGCGKSTLLNLAAGLLRPSRGRVASCGLPLRDRNQRAGYMFQADALMPWRTALDNALAGLEFAGVPMPEARDRGRQWLERVGLTGAEHLYPHQMSGGMRKRVALAQMLILGPALLLMDEPFSALDVQTRDLVSQELLGLWSADRKSVLFITHDLEEAIALADRVVVMSAGPGSHPLGEFVIDLPRPRDVVDIRHSERFVKLHGEIWAVLKDEVMRTYRRRDAGTTP